MRISDWSSDVCSSDLGRQVPVRLIGEAHVTEDLGRIPSFVDWARLIQPMPWVLRGNPAGSPGLDPTIETVTAVAIGRASCRETVCPFVSVSVVAVSLQKNNNYRSHFSHYLNIY